MRSHYSMFLLLLSLSCTKAKQPANDVDEKCDMPAIYALNASKVNFANGIWGTVSITQGNCMPMFNEKNSCSFCVIEREVRIYEYTKIADAVQNKAGGPF